MNEEQIRFDVWMACFYMLSPYWNARSEPVELAAWSGP